MPVYFSQRNLTGRHSVHHFQHYTKFRKKVNTFLKFENTKNLTNIYKYVKIETT